MLVYHVEWHMRRALAPLLFDDEQRGAPRVSPVQPARRSPTATAKAKSKRTVDDLPVQSFHDWIADLATIVKNQIEPQVKSIPACDIITRPTPPQQRALHLPGATL
ncbi:MAG: hypothetical protein HYZ57_05465 [Acidobacteria bacterium]|nr:hypothetical protein [Acidobacteriota bacterium]MBI3279274.1 hypothetical protein [Acidobacteriota bacterium]